MTQFLYVRGAATTVSPARPSTTEPAARHYHAPPREGTPQFSRSAVLTPSGVCSSGAAPPTHAPERPELEEWCSEPKGASWVGILWW